MKQIIKQFSSYFFLIAITFGASFLGNTYLSANNFFWYDQLIKPNLTPPSWMFSVVWPILYFLMASAAWIIWKRNGFFCKELYWYSGQLIVNALYMPLFFGYHLLLPSSVLIIVLIALITKTVQLFLKVDSYAGLLLMPYLIWSCFAFYLSSGIVLLNIS